MKPLWPDLLLPCSPSWRCLDRFSLLDEEGDDGQVAYWTLLQHVLQQPVNTPAQLIDVLDTIANTSCGSSGAAGDFGTLREAVEHHSDTFFSRLWPTIVQLSLKLPDHFPRGTIPVLRPGDKLSLTRDMVACLVAHQFLCTFRAPPWGEGYHDFSIWYDSEQRHPQAVRMYLTALFQYFEELSTDPRTASLENSVDSGVEFSLRAFDDAGDFVTGKRDQIRLRNLDVVHVQSFSTEQQELSHQGHDGAVVVSANKDIGFGQSATQEELFMGNCPEACPAVLFTSTLQDDQILAVCGARPMLRILGQRRDLAWEKLWSGARQGGKHLREVRKAYTAFLSWSGGDAPTVWTGLWGCGAFNGDPATKGDFGDKCGRFVKKVASTWTVRELEDCLKAIPQSIRRLETIDWLLNNVPDC
ncbi:poly glycohydrolase domain-containing protein [Trichoderma velutinum]